jgi:hypothetical protein
VASNLLSRAPSLGALACLSWLTTGGIACSGLGGTASSGAAASGALTREEHSNYFPIATGSKHASIQCAECHDAPASFSTFTCQSCHAHASDVAAMRHLYVTGFEYVSNACLNCHPTGWEAPILPADHSLKYFPIQSGSHDDLLCRSCHTDPSTAKSFVCIGCHDQATSAGQHSSTSGYAWTDAGCYGCHPQDK